MLTRNIDLEKGLCNGATGIVVDINEFLQVQVQFAHGLEWIVPVQYDLIDYTRDGKTKSVGHRVQVPLVLSWALTIHKAQGTTIDSPTLMNLGDSVFAPAQAYVALSRVRRLDCLHFINISKSSLHADAQAVIYCTNNIKTLSA
jgi:ATP-dependent DNA helicase PIF1